MSRRVLALLLACAAAQHATGWEGFQDAPAAARAPPSFLSGTDVFGRAPPCRACHALLHNLQSVLVPKLSAQMKRDARRRAAGNTPAARRVDFGAYEGASGATCANCECCKPDALPLPLPLRAVGVGTAAVLRADVRPRTAVRARLLTRGAAASVRTAALIQDDVPRGCFFSTTYHDREVRRACDAMMETHEDAIADVYQRWVQAGGEDAVAWSWNYELCFVATAGACPEPLARRPLTDFADDGSGAADRTYRTEQPPKPGTRVEGMLKVVAATFHEAVSNDTRRDVLVYVAFPQTAQDAHFAILPTLAAATRLLRAPAAEGGAGDGIEVAHFDGDVNDAPPPHARGAATPGLILYPAHGKVTPRYIQRFAEGQLTLYDVLYFVAATAGRDDVADAAAKLLRTLPDEQLLARPWEAEAEEFADPAWHTAAARARDAAAAEEAQHGSDAGENEDDAEL